MKVDLRWTDASVTNQHFSTNALLFLLKKAFSGATCFVLNFWFRYFRVVVLLYFRLATLRADHLNHPDGFCSLAFADIMIIDIFVRVESNMDYHT